MALDLSSGLPALWADARQFAADIRLARPTALWLALLPLVLAILQWQGNRRDRMVLGLLGRPAAVFALIVRPRPRGRPFGFFRLLAWSILVLAAAGPRWGEGAADGVAVGRDVVLALDLSRSMVADDIGGRPRWQAELAGAAGSRRFTKSLTKLLFIWMFLRPATMTSLWAVSRLVIWTMCTAAGDWSVQMPLPWPP